MLPCDVARVLSVADSWVGTPYHHYARVKGVGVDCATLLAEVYAEAGIIGAVEIPAYSAQWHIHRVEEKYTDFIRKFAVEVFDTPHPADIIVWRFHNTYSHGGIVVSWPRIVHALIDVGCIYDDVSCNFQLNTVTERTSRFGEPREYKIFRLGGGV